jgi:hypothetical protein
MAPEPSEDSLTASEGWEDENLAGTAPGRGLNDGHGPPGKPGMVANVHGGPSVPVAGAASAGTAGASGPPGATAAAAAAAAAADRQAEAALFAGEMSRDAALLQLQVCA